MHGTILDKLPCTEKLLRLKYDAVQTELTEVAQAYDCTLVDVEAALSPKLLTSRGHMGTCNAAVGFLIEDVRAGNKHKNLIAAIDANILGAAIYYGNGVGVSPLYGEA